MNGSSPLESGARDEPCLAFVLEELHRALMLFRFRAGIERSQVFSSASF
jgi:hypothetical protein